MNIIMRLFSIAFFITAPILMHLRPGVDYIIVIALMGGCYFNLMGELLDIKDKLK